MLKFYCRNLSGTDKTASTVLLRLFKLVFSSIPLFPENETVLQPHLATIVTSAMKYQNSFLFYFIFNLSFFYCVSDMHLKSKNH
jgi:hypothetical protein